MRLYRREWHQQALILALLTIAVAAAIFSASSAYNIAPVPGNAEFGTVNHYLKFDGSDPQALAAALDAAEEWFGTIDVIAHRQAPVPGSVESIEIRAQDPQGSYSTPMLALLEGRYPTAGGEVAVTDGVATFSNSASAARSHWMAPSERWSVWWRTPAIYGPSLFWWIQPMVIRRRR
jgi:putative ABC transport system permease protein